MIALNFPEPSLTPSLRPRTPRASSPWLLTCAILIPLFLLMAALAFFDIRLAGILYALTVFALSFFRPHISLMLAFSLAPFVQELPIPGPLKISVGEFTLALCIPAFLITSLPRLRFPAFLFCSLLYLAACLFTTFMNHDTTAIAPLAQIALYLVVTVLVFSSLPRDARHFTFILDGALIVASLLALLTFTPVAAALDINKNSLGASMTSGLLIAVESWFASHRRPLRRRILTGVMFLLAATLLLSLSRGAWLAALSGLVVLITLRRQFKLLLKLTAFLIPLVIVLFLCLPEEQQEYALSADATRANIQARYDTIEDAKAAFFQHPVYGGGISYRKNIDATNIVFVSLAESGILGLSAFALLHAALFLTIYKTQRTIPRSHSLYSPVALGAALVLAHLTHGMVDHYWSRGPILQAWATTGMAAAIAAQLRTRTRAIKSQPTGWLDQPLSENFSPFESLPHRDPTATFNY